MDDVIVEKDKVKNVQKKELAQFIVLFSVFIILVITLVISSYSLSDNSIDRLNIGDIDPTWLPRTLPTIFYYGFLGSDFVAFVLFKSAVNLLIYMPVISIPIIILGEYEKDKEIDSMWILAIPTISVVGAFIDSQVVFNNIGLLVGLALNFILFCVAVMLLMNYKLITGIIIGVVAVATNYIFQMYVSLSSDILFWVMMVAIVIFLFITAMFMNNTRQILMRSRDVSKSDYLRQFISYSTSCMLILYVLMI